MHSDRRPKPEARPSPGWEVHKKDHCCEVVKNKDGKVAFWGGGKEYGSPSAAGSAVMGGTACNGWRFWSVEGTDTKPKATTTAKKGASRAKAATKPKARAKRAAKPKKARKVAGGANGDPETPVEKPVNCGVCGQEFPTSREAADHMRDEHNSLEAAGSGGR